jgi:small subunit ribosomal protein S9
MKATWATGRRKTAVAQVRILPGNGNISVNGSDINEYFPVELYRINALKPLSVTKNENKFDCLIRVKGGGKSGQTGAVQLAIARAIGKIGEEYHETLRDAGLLTRDPRMVERKKYGQKKARKRFQFSKR